MTTRTELMLMAAVAIIGLSKRPLKGSSMPVEIGTARTLKMNTKNNFARCCAWGPG